MSWYTQSKARWLSALVLRASSLTRSLAAKPTHPLNTQSQSAHTSPLLSRFGKTSPLNSSQFGHSHFGNSHVGHSQFGHSQFGTTSSMNSRHHPMEAFSLVDSPHRLAQSNSTNRAQSNSRLAQSNSNQAQSNGKLSDLAALALVLSSNKSINSHTVTATACTRGRKQYSSLTHLNHPPIHRRTHSMNIPNQPTIQHALSMNHNQICP